MGDRQLSILDFHMEQTTVSDYLYVIEFFFFDVDVKLSNYVADNHVGRRSMFIEVPRAD